MKNWATSSSPRSTPDPDRPAALADQELVEAGHHQRWHHQHPVHQVGVGQRLTSTKGENP